MSGDREPFSNPSIFDSDKDPVQSGEKFTVGEWKILTEGWHPDDAYIAKIITVIPVEQRKSFAQKLNIETLFGEFGESSDWSVFVADIFSLSDGALSRLNQALAINEMEGKLQKPTKPE